MKRSRRPLRSPPRSAPPLAAHRVHPPTLRLRLPPLDPHQAFLVAEVLERLLHALWRTYGADLADHAAALGLDTPRPKDAVFSRADSPRTTF